MLQSVQAPLENISLLAEVGDGSGRVEVASTAELEEKSDTFGGPCDSAAISNDGDFGMDEVKPEKAQPALNDGGQSNLDRAEILRQVCVSPSKRSFSASLTCCTQCISG